VTTAAEMATPCAHLEAHSFLNALPRVRGVRCTECLEMVRRAKRPPRLRTPDEREVDAARALPRTLADLGCVQRWRAHAAAPAGALAGMQGTSATTDADDAKAAHGARPLTVTATARDDVAHDADRARGRRLDAVLRRLEAGRRWRARDAHALELLRVLASLLAYVEGRPMPAPLPAAWVPERTTPIAVLVFLAEHVGATRAKGPLAEIVGQAFADADKLRTWCGMAGTKKERRTKRATPAHEVTALRAVRLKRDGAAAAAAHGAPLLRAAVALWVKSAHANE